MQHSHSKMELYCFSFFILLSFMYTAMVNGGSTTIPLCLNTVSNQLNCTVLYNDTSTASQTSKFCFCTMQSQHAFSLEVKRIQADTQSVSNDSLPYMFFTSGGRENSTCDRINLMDVYNKPFKPDCLVAFSPNQSSSQPCWSNIKNVSAFGFYQNLSSYMNLYMVLKGDGIINITCNCSGDPPAMFPLDDGCERDNSSLTVTENNNATSTPRTKAVQMSSLTHETKMAQNTENFFSTMNIGILLISIGAGFLLLSVFLMALTCRKRLSSKKDAPTEQDVEKTSQAVSMTKEYGNTIPDKDTSEKYMHLSVARNTCSFHDGITKMDDDPLTRRHTDGHIDLELQELDRRPHYDVTKDLNQENDGIKQLLSDKKEGNVVQVEAEDDKKQNVDKVVYENEQSHDLMDKNQPLSKQCLHTVNPYSTSASEDKTHRSSMEGQSQKQHNAKAISQDNRLNTVTEQDMETTDGKPDSIVLDSSVDRDNEEAIYENCSKHSNSETIPTSTLVWSDNLEPYVNISKHTDSNHEDPTKSAPLSPIERLPDEQDTESTMPQDDSAPGHHSSKTGASESNSLLNSQNNTTHPNQVKTIIDAQNAESKHSSKFPSASTSIEEPDYDTISNSSETNEIESKNKWQNKQLDSKSSVGENTTSMVRKESVKVVFLKPQPVTSSDEESLCSQLEAEKKMPKSERLKQTRSACVDVMQEPQVKPERSKQSINKEELLKNPDAELQYECDHLYDEVDDDLKELSISKSKSETTNEENNSPPSDKTPVINKSTEMPEENEELSFLGQCDNHETKYDIQNSDDMVDNDIYTLPDEAFENMALNQTNPYTLKTGSVKLNESDYDSAL